MLRPTSAPRISDDLHALLEASPNAIVAVDADGRIVYANPRVEGTFGYAPDEVLGRSVDTLVPLDVARVHSHHRASFMAQATARPMGIGLDLAGRRRDGSAVPVEISLVPLETSTGRIVFATIVDITARTALEAQLRQAQKMESIGRLAGGIAHDFNNMLFAIRSYTDMLAEDVAAVPPVSPTALQASIAGIDRAAEQATQLTAQLLAFSRQQVVQPTVLDLREAVTNIEPMLRRLIGENLRLGLDLDRSSGHVRMDPMQLDQVLVNLVVNARDAMPDGGTVSIETGTTVVDGNRQPDGEQVPPGAYAILAVHDTGIGMDEQTRAHAFEPFFTTKAVGKGTGLGLALVYGVVSQASGHITIESRPGVGTSFRLYLPISDLETPQPPSHDTSVPAARGRVLLVEDEPYVRDAARIVLARAGFDVRATGDPREALTILEQRSTPLDVLVTDLVMPDLSGRDLAERAFAARPDVGVVIVSGYTPEPTDIADLVAMGARFASKPLSARDLVALVASALPSERRPA